MQTPSPSTHDSWHLARLLRLAPSGSAGGGKHSTLPQQCQKLPEPPGWDCPGGEQQRLVPRPGTKSQGFLLGVSEELETLCRSALSRVYRTRSRHSEPLTSSSCRGRSKEKTRGYEGPILSGPLPHVIGSVQSPGQGAVLHFKVRLPMHEHGRRSL